MKISNLFFYLLKINDKLIYMEKRDIFQISTFYTRLLTLMPFKTLN